MATCPAAAAEEEEKTEACIDPESRYHHIISTLASDSSFPHTHLRKYQGYWYPEQFLPSAMAFQDQFKPHPTDIFLCSSPKCGTTWLKALTFAVTRRNEYPPRDLGRHPLVHESPHQCVPMIDRIFDCNGHAPQLDAIPPPRLLSAHLAYSLLPESVKGSECPIIYVCREPKDALVSHWHFNRQILINREAVAGAALEPMPLGLFVDKFCEGTIPLGPFWEHAMEYWKESLRRPEKILFFKYEDMLEDPERAVRRLAEFVGQPFLEEEGRVVEEIVRLCSFDNLRSVPGNNTGKHSVQGIEAKNSAFFRKGKMGEWKNHLTPEMAQKVDGITEEKLRGSGLNFSNMLVPPVVGDNTDGSFYRKGKAGDSRSHLTPATA